MGTVLTLGNGSTLNLDEVRELEVRMVVGPRVTPMSKPDGRAWWLVGHTRRGTPAKLAECATAAQAHDKARKWGFTQAESNGRLRRGAEAGPEA